METRALKKKKWLLFFYQIFVFEEVCSHLSLARPGLTVTFKRFSSSFPPPTSFFHPISICRTHPSLSSFSSYPVTLSMSSFNNSTSSFVAFLSLKFEMSAINSPSESYTLHCCAHTQQSTVWWFSAVFTPWSHGSIPLMVCLQNKEQKNIFASSAVQWIVTEVVPPKVRGTYQLLFFIHRVGNWEQGRCYVMLTLWSFSTLILYMKHIRNNKTLKYKI